MTSDDALRTLREEIVECRLCPRLVAWRERVALEKVKRFADWDYWGRAVPSFGDDDDSPRLLVLGLAPAAHGANRTGRMFTGDRSGEWLYRALHRAGFSNQPTFERADDGLRLMDCRISAVCHCAPPDNKPLPEEKHNCQPYLVRELEALRELRVVVALGKIAFDAVARIIFEKALSEDSKCGKKPDWTPSRLRFSHGAEYRLRENLTLLGSYHPSQQNTFTGKLTEPMFDAVFTRVGEILRS